jgi:hypothetical protein
LVRATDVQNCVAQWPGARPCPITQPVRVPTKVTEVGRKLPGTGDGAFTAELADTDAPLEVLLAADWAEFA